jgi:hypothetical protein
MCEEAYQSSGDFAPITSAQERWAAGTTLHMGTYGPFTSGLDKETIVATSRLRSGQRPPFLGHVEGFRGRLGKFLP